MKNSVQYFIKKLFLFLKMENLQSVKNISVGWDILKKINSKMSKDAFYDPRPLTEETLKELGFKKETCEDDIGDGWKEQTYYTYEIQSEQLKC